MYSSMHFCHMCAHSCISFCITMVSFLGGVYLGVESLGHGVLPTARRLMEPFRKQGQLVLRLEGDASGAHQMRVYLVWGDIDLGTKGPA